MKQVSVLSGALVCVVFLCGISVFAQSGLQSVVRAKAAPDECYAGLGLNGPAPVKRPPCALGSIPKVNQGYVWSMVTTGDDVWFGTAPNPLCLAESGASILVSNPLQTDSWACEFGSSPYSTSYGMPLPPEFGDYRPPSIYVYHRATQTLTDLTPIVRGVPGTSATTGLRAAAIVGDMVFFAGPALSAAGGLNIFAFQISTKKFLGTRTLLQYRNIRRFVEHDGVLYAAVSKNAGGGAILKWTGTPSVACLLCFRFEVVGNLDAGAADLAAHNGRLYATTWPDDPTKDILAGLWMSPAVPSGGLATTDAANWKEVWRADQYEPDSVVARSYGGGALASFGGYLFWGTLHEPWVGTAVWGSVYGMPTTSQQQAAAITGTLRSTVLFRGRDFETDQPAIDLVFGNSKLPVYVPPQGTTPGVWTLTTNRMSAGHTEPLFGPSGYGYLFNTYTWAMTVWNGRLWIGTMDWSYMAAKGAAVFGLTIPPRLIDPNAYGGDLISFADASMPPSIVSTTGVGNYSNYGIRNFAAGDTLFIGMANGMNLLTDTADAIPEGGWELIEASQ